MSGLNTYTRNSSDYRFLQISHTSNELKRPADSVRHCHIGKPGFRTIDAAKGEAKPTDEKRLCFTLVPRSCCPKMSKGSNGGYSIGGA